MKIVLESDDSIQLLAADGMLTIEAANEEQAYSPFHMLASSLATCIFGVLESWASQAELTVNDLSVRVHWSFADNPHRVERMQVQLLWPSLPEPRVSAAKRVAALCAVHATLMHHPQIDIETAPDPVGAAVTT
jgi:uncharacterized OsmC-like protein